MSDYSNKDNIYDFERNREEALKKKIISILSEEKLSFQTTKLLFLDILSDIQNYNPISL